MTIRRAAEGTAIIYSPKAQLLGGLSIFGSAFFLYLSTLVIRWAQGRVLVDPAYFVFARFILGFAVVSAAMSVRGHKIKVHRWHLLIGRTVGNTLSVFCFYKAVSLTTVAEANILNMTYPLFVTVFSWMFLSKQRDLPATLILMVAVVGVWLVLSPGKIGLNIGNLWGLASGMLGAAAIIYLNLSRQEHDTHTILFFMFGFGSLGIFLLFHEHIFVPDLREFLFLISCAACGVIGQYLLTIGFRYVTAMEGSIVSSSRILLAAVLGPYLAADPPLSLAGWVGALMIFGADVLLAYRKVSA
ncbi:MAG: DMT family transporter [Thermodesulfobacteriota bacterium]